MNCPPPPKQPPFPPPTPPPPAQDAKDEKRRTKREKRFLHFYVSGSKFQTDNSKRFCRKNKLKKGLNLLIE